MHYRSLFFWMYNSKSLLIKVYNKSKLTTAINRNSFVYEIEQLAHELNFDIKVMLINRNRFSAEFIFNEIPEEVYESITNSFQYWHLQEQRNIFKNIMEENIPR